MQTHSHLWSTLAVTLHIHASQPMDAAEQPISISGLQQEAAKKSLGILGGGGSPRKGRYSLLGQREEKEPDERL